ncbi:hypothetical protein [Streptomyces brasiliensis]|uniref:Calcium-binding protein n=1 Tax=Streptomyces brasiliensis TaxID=1954 RepID=A0A917NV95_9ACTN|nr:hypothetical protein [Streptomyces brasiliensis]GGJ28220.1 hypothetical protein GCM10010121_044450 [Streptomyces brasiliensis]
MSLRPTTFRAGTVGLGAGALAVAAAAVLVGARVSGGDPEQAQPAPPPATRTAAARVSSDDNKVYYTAADGQTNKVVITFTHNADFTTYTFTIRDDVAITSGAGCVHPDATDRKLVACTSTAPGDEASDLTSLVVNLDDGDDRLKMDPAGPAYTEIFGGDGDDVLLGGGRDVFYGGNGDDRIEGGGGAYGEGANGGPGDDVLTGCGEYCHP